MSATYEAILATLSMSSLPQLLQRIDHGALTIPEAVRVPGEDGVLGVAGEFLDDGERDVLRDQVGDVAVPELVKVVRRKPQVSAGAF